MFAGQVQIWENISIVPVIRIETTARGVEWFIYGLFRKNKIDTLEDSFPNAINDRDK